MGVSSGLLHPLSCALAQAHVLVACAVQFSFEAVYPLFAFTRKELGGLELAVS